MENLIGTQLGRYQLIAAQGESDIAMLYKAYDTRLERNVMLKLVTHSKNYSAEFIDYFLKEARVLAQLSHSNIVRVLDFGQEQGYLFLVTEYVEGQPLADRLGAPIDWQDAVQILLPLADALDYAHEHQIIHRDLTPANIIINAENQPVLSDFSLARIIEEEETREMTGTNVGLGSPYYMSPEQGKGLPVDYRADIYALGVIFYEMVTGRKPFTADSGMETVIQQVMAQVEPPHKYVSGLPDAIEKIILTMLKKNPRERYQSMREFIEAVQKYQSEVAARGRAGSRVRLSGRALAARVIFGLAGLVLLATIGAVLVLTGILPNPLQAKQTATVVAIVPATPIPSATHAAVVEANAATPTIKPTETQTPVPTKTVVSGETPTPLIATTQAPMVFPTYPLLMEKTLPALKNPITTANAAQIVEIARWGSPLINAIQWTVDGQYLVSATSAGIYYLDPADLNPKYFINGKGWLTTITVSEDGRHIASGDQTGMIRVWDAHTGQEVHTLPGHTGQIMALDFSPDGTRLLSGSTDRTARMWDLTEWKELPKLPQHGRTVTAVAFSKNGLLALTASEDFHTIISDVSTNKQVGDLISNQSMILDMVVSENNQTVAIALYNATVEIWDLTTQKRTYTLNDGEVTPIVALSYAPNSRLLAAAGADGQVRIWNTGSGEIQWRLKAAANPDKADKDLDQVLKVAYAKDGSRLVSLTKGGTLITWNMYTQEVMQKGSVLYTGIKRMVVAPDNHMMAYQAQDQLVYTWSIPKAARIKEFNAILPRGNPISFDSQMMALVSIAGDTLGLYQTDAGTESLKNTLKNYPETGQVYFLPDGKIVGASTSRSLMLWSVASGHELSSDAFKYQDNCQVAHSAEGAFLAAGSILGTFLDENTANAFCKNSRNPRSLDITYTKDGKLLAFGLDNNKVDLWSIGEKRSNLTFTAGDKKILAVAFSPDGQLLATGGEDGKIRIWNTADKAAMESGNPLIVLVHHAGSVYDLLFSADGTMLFSSSQDGTILLWGIIQ